MIEYTEQFAKSSKEYQILKMHQFSCFCGLRFSDAMTLTWKNLDFENNIIRKTIIKTKTDVITPLFPMARDILMEWSKNGVLLNNGAKVFYNYAEPTVNHKVKSFFIGKIFGTKICILLPQSANAVVYCNQTAIFQYLRLLTNHILCEFTSNSAYM